MTFIYEATGLSDKQGCNGRYEVGPVEDALRLDAIVLAKDTLLTYKASLQVIGA